MASPRKRGARVFTTGLAAAVAAASLAVGMAGGAPGEAAKAKRGTIAGGFNIPWGMDFLPNGNALVAERETGRIYAVSKKGRKREVMTVPGVDQGTSEGGLLGLAVSPSYKRDKLVYAYFTTNSDNRVARFKLDGQLDPVITGLGRASIHNGGRIEFGPDDKLYIGTGDAADPQSAQNKGSLKGKILRINPNGSIPNDNPFNNSPVWSYGHRNVQGFDWDRKGRMWASELGNNEFDEVNLIRPGNNYGWPNREGKGSTDGGKYTNPKVQWQTSESSPSGAAIRGRTLYVAALRGERLWKIPLVKTRAKKPISKYRGKYGRLRTVEVAPGRKLWITTSNGSNDRIIKVGG